MAVPAKAWPAADCISRIYERTLHSVAPFGEQRIHDTRMVWASEAPTERNIRQLAADRRHCFLMAYCILRILLSGAGKQNRIYRQRRSVHARTAQSDTGMYQSRGIHRDDKHDVWQSGTALEPLSCLSLSCSGCISGVSEMIF